MVGLPLLSGAHSSSVLGPGSFEIPRPISSKSSAVNTSHAVFCSYSITFPSFPDLKRWPNVSFSMRASTLGMALSLKKKYEAAITATNI